MVEEDKILEIKADVARLEQKIRQFGTYNLGGTLALGLSVGLYIAHEHGKGETGMVNGARTGASAPLWVG